MTGESSAPVPNPDERAQPSPAREDEFDRALRALTEGNPPSAWLREASAAERKNDARQARRKRERARKRYEKLEKKDLRQQQRQRKKDSRTASYTAQGRRPGGRRDAVAAAVALIVILGGGAWAASTRLHLWPAVATGGPNDTQVITNGAVPTGSAVSTASASGPPADPFAGTPAVGWADGAAGIVVPAAGPVGEYSKAQVEYAYQTTKKLLDAAALDRQTLLGGAPTAMASLLSRPDRTQFIKDLNKIGLNKNGSPVSSRADLVTFAPGSTALIGSVIKVHGTMSAHTATDSYGVRVLDVKINYLFVYPVEPPKAPQDWTRVVAHFDGDVWFGDWSGAQTSFAPWWETGPSVANVRCAMADGYVHPYYPNSVPDKVKPSGPAINPYSLQQEISVGCGQITGT